MRRTGWYGGHKGLWLALMVALLPGVANAGAKTSVGTEYVVTFQPGGGNPKSLFMTSETEATGTVEIPGLGFKEDFTVAAGQMTEVKVPANVTTQTINGISKGGIHVTSNAPIQLYGLNRAVAQTDGFLALPVSALGTDYIAVGQAGIRAQITIVGVEDNTSVTIVPSAPVKNWAAGQPFTIALKRFETFLLAADYKVDLTGTSISASAPVAVISGDLCANVVRGACDHLTEMLPPVETFGRRYFTHPYAACKGYPYAPVGGLLRVVASRDGTKVYLGGELAGELNAGAHLDQLVTKPVQIDASAPVMVAQFVVGNGMACSDPSLVLVPPVEQYLDRYVVAVPSGYGSGDFANITIPTDGIGTLQLDGVAVDPAMFVAIGSIGFSSAAIPLTAGAHSIHADVPFGVQVYGYANVESYGYPGGMALETINPIHGNFRNVRVVSTLAKNGIEVVPGSFNLDPIRVEEFADRVEVEWKLPGLFIGDVQNLEYDVALKSPIGGEQRLVSERVEIVYDDVNGVEHRRLLQEQYVSVLPSAYQLAVALDDAGYAAGETGTISAVVKNVGRVEESLRLELEVRDGGGNLFSSLAPVEGLSVGAGGELVVAPVGLSTSGMYAGAYRLHARLVNGLGGVVAQASSDFRVDVPSGAGLSASLATDKQVYDAWGKVQISAHVLNQAPNAIHAPTIAVLSISRGDGTPVYTEASALGEIYPSGEKALSFLVWLADEETGPFNALLTISQGDGTMVASAMTTFRVERAATAGLVGFVDVAKPVVFRGEANLCTDTVSNFGTAEVGNFTVRHRLIATGSGQIVDEKASVRSLAGNGTLTDVWSIATQPMAVGEYACLLSVDVSGAQKELAMGGFLVKEPPVKIASGWQAGTRGRLLVLLDKASNDDHCGDRRVHLHARHGLALGKDAKVEVRLLDGAGKELVKSAAANDGKWSPGQDGDDRLSIEAFDDQGLSVDVDAAEGVHAVQATVVSRGNTLRFSTGPMHHPCGGHDHHRAFGDFAVVDTGRSAANDHHHLPPEPDPAAQRAFIEAQLQSEGWSYTIVDDAQAFAGEFHHGGYSAYVLLSERVKLPEDLQDELVEAVHRGEGLLVAGDHDRRNKRLDEVLGVARRGELPKASGITVPGTDWLNAGEALFGTSTRAMAISPAKGAVVVGRYTGLGGGSHDRHDVVGPACHDPGPGDVAVTSHGYGKGRSVYAGFDLLAEATQTGGAALFTELLRAATGKVHPDQVPMKAGNALPLVLHLENQGMAVSGRVVVTLPAGARVIDAGAGTVQADGTVLWPFGLGVGESLDLPLLAIYPAGAQQVTATIQTASGAGYVDYGTAVETLTLAAAPDWAAVQSAAKLLGMPKWTGEPYRRCAHDLSRAKSDFDRKDYRDALEHLTDAVQPIKGLSGGVDLRLSIDELLRDVGTKTP